MVESSKVFIVAHFVYLCIPQKLQFGILSICRTVLLIPRALAVEVANYNVLLICHNNNIAVSLFVVLWLVDNFQYNQHSIWIDMLI